MLENMQGEKYWRFNSFDNKIALIEILAKIYEDYFCFQRSSIHVATMLLERFHSGSTIILIIELYGCVGRVVEVIKHFLWAQLSPLTTVYVMCVVTPGLAHELTT